MPDYDPKSIPVLDDIIEDEIEDGDETTTHKKIILPDGISTDENSLDLFSEATADIEIENAEPEIGIIDNVIDDDTNLKIESLDTQDDNSHIVESALIDYSFESNSEDDATAEAQTEDEIHPADEQNNQPAELTEPRAIIDPAITLDSIVDDIVTQLMPDLEQQLRTRLKQALQESLPQEVAKPALPE